MQEQAANSLRQMTELSAPGNTPSLEEVRDKIERRYANAIGQAELAQNSVEGRMLEVQKSTLDMAGPEPAGADPRLAARRPGRGRGHGGPAHRRAALVGPGAGGPARDPPGAAARHELIPHIPDAVHPRGGRRPRVPGPDRPTKAALARSDLPNAAFARSQRRARAARARAPCRGAGAGPGWQRGHQYATRAYTPSPCSPTAIRVPQRKQRCRPRSNTQCWRPRASSPVVDCSGRSLLRSSSSRDRATARAGSGTSRTSVQGESPSRKHTSAL